MKAPTTLTFSTEEVLEKYSEFFKVYPISVEETKIGEVFKKDFEEKKSFLREFFPLDGEGRALVASYEDIAATAQQALSHTYSMLRSLSEGIISSKDIDNIIFNNKIPDGSRFSKWILKYTARSLSSAYVKECLTRNDLCAELPRLPLKKRDDLETVVQNFYSELASLKKMQVKLYISVSPYDIANAATGKAQSCNSIGKMHETAALCAASSEHIGILRLENESGELLGRCYISFSPDMLSFVVQPPYGYMKEEFVADAKQWLSSIIDKKIPAGVDIVWKEYKGNLGISARDVSSENTANFYVDASSSCLYRTDFSELPAIRVGGNVCLACGKPENNLVCGACRKKFKKCTHCGNICGANETLCLTCASAYRVCSKCGKEFFNIYSLTVCDACRYMKTTCLYCNRIVVIDTTRSLADQSIIELVDYAVFAHQECAYALQNKSSVCPTCGGVLSQWGDCYNCAIKSDVYFDIRSTLKKFSYLRNILKGTSNVVKFSANPNLVYPEEYAMAA